MSWLLALPLALAASPAQAVEIEWHGRVEALAAMQRLPGRDARAPEDGRQREDLRLDLRGQWRLQEGAWRVEADVQALLDYGSALRGSAGGVPSGGVAGEGDADLPRAFDAARVLEADGAHRLRLRVDRLLVGYRSDAFAFSLGRQALSWGNGQVFAPMDLLSPFAPTTIDRDFKPGDDLALAQWQLEEGRDLQVVAVARRDAQGRRTTRAGSVGLHWQQPVGESEVALLAAHHIDDDVLGIGVSMPVADAVVRADWVYTHLQDGGGAASLVLNADRSFVVAERNLYAFVELYRNGFGRGETPRDIASLSPALTARLARGEVFTTSRWYAALGGTIEWHSLLRQQVLVLGSLQDGSASLQSSLRYEPDDRTRVDATLGWAGGGRGDEFAGLPLRADIGTAGAPTSTLGGGWRAEVRYAWYW